MEMSLIAFLISLSAFFMYINYRYIKLPETIGIMILSLVFSLVIITIQGIGLVDFKNIISIIKNIDFEKTLMEGMLAFLLFAGALHININDLSKQKWIILVLATIGVIGSTLLVGSITYIIITYSGIFNSSYNLLIYLSYFTCIC